MKKINFFLLNKNSNEIFEFNYLNLKSRLIEANCGESFLLNESQCYVFSYCRIFQIFYNLEKVFWIHYGRSRIKNLQTILYYCLSKVCAQWLQHTTENQKSFSQKCQSNVWNCCQRYFFHSYCMFFDGHNSIVYSKHFQIRTVSIFFWIKEFSLVVSSSNISWWEKSLVKFKPQYSSYIYVSERNQQ